MQYYVLAPLIAIAFLWWKKNRLPKPLPVFIIMLAGLLARVIKFQTAFPSNETQYMWDIYASFFLNLDLFLFGFALNLIVPDRDETSHWHPFKGKTVFYVSWIGLIALGIFANTVYYTMLQDYSANIYIQGAILPTITSLAIGFFIYGTETAKNRSAKTQNNSGFTIPLHLIEAIGVLSYSIYLFHIVVLFKFGLNCPHYCTGSEFTVKYLTLIIVVTFISLLLAYLPKLVFLKVRRLFP
jgi:peptidoglycan/LPS O-acetylase OafA/YrhL